MSRLSQFWSYSVLCQLDSKGRDHSSLPIFHPLFLPQLKKGLETGCTESEKGFLAKTENFVDENPVMQISEGRVWGGPGLLMWYENAVVFGEIMSKLENK